MEMITTLSEEFCLALNKRYPTLSRDSNFKTVQFGQSINKILLYYINLYGKDHLLKQGVDAFARVSFDFLRYQARFERTRHYQQLSQQELGSSLYQNSEKMDDYYLNGLFLTYAFWENHIKIYDFFIEQFLKKIKLQSAVFEVGMGHGLFATTLLDIQKNCHFTGYDLSSSAIKMTRAILTANNINERQYNLVISDINDIDHEQHQYDYAICSELLEHLEKPAQLLSKIYKILRSEGRFFVTTVANIAAEDHVYLFNNLDEIRDLIHSCKFTIENELVLPLQAYITQWYTPLNYAAILKKSN